MDFFEEGNSENLVSDHGINWGEFHNWYWNDIKCHWRVFGEETDPPIVFVHGFGASSSHWRKNVAFFAKSGYRVFGIDLIGFGISEQPGLTKQKYLDNFFWSNQLIAFLEEIVGKRHKEKAVLIGNSLGGLVSITTASLRPDLVKAIIASPLPDPAFMAPFDFPEISILKKIRGLLVKAFFKILPLEVLLPIISRTSIIKKALQSAYHRSVRNDFDLLKIVSAPAQRPTAPRALRAMCIGMTLRPKSYTAPILLKRLAESLRECPILMVWGAKDKLVPLNIGKLIVKEHPWLDLLVIENSGHCVHDETADNFNQNVLEWLVELNLSFNSQIS